MSLLSIKQLSVNTMDKNILNFLNLEVEAGSIHLIMGRNGSGKSTLLNTIMGNPEYTVMEGNIVFENRDITKLEVYKRAKAGIYLCMQTPPAIEGLTTAELLRNKIGKNNPDFKLFSFVTELENSAEHLGLKKEMLHRSINEGFSGGERKKNEILQLQMLKPKLILLDEIDSGVDVDSLKIVLEVINNYKKENSDTSIIMISHNANILRYIEPDYVHILDHGHLIKSGGVDLVHQVENEGFQKTVKCAVGEYLNE